MFKKNILPERFREPATWQWNHFRNARGGQLRYGLMNNVKEPAATIIYAQGLSEYAEKTFELARDFNANACNFAVLDRYGQGLSDRPLKDRFKQHSTGFQHDVDDLIQLTNDLKTKNIIREDTPVILLGHSTGGLLSLMALHQEPDLFQGAVLTAPLLGFGNPILKDRECFFGHLPLPRAVKERYVPGEKPWRGRFDPENTMSPEDFTTDADRNTLMEYWEKTAPDLRTGLPTYGWVINACKAILKVRCPAYLNDIKQPLLLFTAGDDKIVNNAPTDKAAPHLPHAHLVLFKDSKHEMLMEKDDIRTEIIKRTMDFIKNSL